MTLAASQAGACRLCDAQNPTLVRPYRARTSQGRELFRNAAIYECPSCGFMQAAPLPAADALAAYYSSNYWHTAHPGSALDDDRAFPADNLVQNERGRSIAALVASMASDSPTRILDIGAGRGYVLHALHARFPDATRMAVEPSLECRQHLDRIGVVATDEPVESFLAAHVNAFDVIVLSHVLEHFADPLALLRLIRRAATDGGLLCLEVPHAGRDVDALVHPWTGEGDEPHLSFFSAATLTRCVETAGLRVITCDTVGPRFRASSLAERGASALRTLARRMAPSAVARRLSGQRRGAGAPEKVFYEYGGLRIWLRCVARNA